MLDLCLILALLPSNILGAVDESTGKDSAAGNALAAFERLCGGDEVDGARTHAASVLEVSRIDEPQDLTQPLTWEMHSDGFIVPIHGRLFRVYPKDFVAAAPKNTRERKNTRSPYNGKWEEGIIGQVCCELDGSPYRIIRFVRPSNGMLGVKLPQNDAMRLISNAVGRTDGTIQLLELDYLNYAWQWTDGQERHFVDCTTGKYFPEDQFDSNVRKRWSNYRNRGTEIAGTSSSFSLAPVAREQFMYQAQNGMQCWPTCISMAFDFFGERIFHEDVADVAMCPGSAENGQ
ncbi:MAG: hypothetical protein HYV26_10190 [Candidatus Hydrogenedentes bacterium]|nr:hypothetical protein [Candidatus Hydrogenedentota bacterium]